jgi:poly-gamma-glutamate capsule biosynthesis protein CapA/YwtB (metallophosphatase superfamily)
MAVTMILTGDVNLMKVADPTVPFRRVGEELRKADVVFGNLECCLTLPATHSHGNEGFFADPVTGGEALRLGGLQAVGIANNVHYGDANIMASVARLDALGIPHTGAGRDLASARAPVILERGGVRFGFLQRSSVYWPTNHEAHADAPGIAVIRGHTAYQVPTFKTRPEIPPPNRPGVPPEIVTWADAAYLRAFTDDVAALRSRVDILVASFHWGLRTDVLDYMPEIAHAAIDAGADIVMGHGPHYSLPVGMHKGRAIFYGLGNLSFHTGHGGRQHGDWLGMLVRADVGRNGIEDVGFRFVRHTDDNETYWSDPDKEAEELADLTERSAAYGAKLVRNGHEVRVGPA